MHFGRAADRMHIVQPALSRQIAALERELGYKLLQRETRPITFTPAGELLFNEVRPSLQRIDKAVASASLAARGLMGSLEIGYIIPAMWTVLLPILREYRKRFPDMNFDLVELPADIQLDNLRDGLLDIGFFRPSVHDESIAFETVLREPTLVAVPAEHPQAHKAEVELADLHDETFIVMNRKLTRAMHDLHFSLFREHGFTPRVIEGNTPASLNLVALGMAVALVPASLRHVGIDGIVFRPISGPPQRG